MRSVQNSEMMVMLNPSASSSKSSLTIKLKDRVRFGASFRSGHRAAGRWLGAEAVLCAIKTTTATTTLRWQFVELGKDESTC